MIEEKIQLILYLDWYGTQLYRSPSTPTLHLVIWLAHKRPVRKKPFKKQATFVSVGSELIIQSIVQRQQTLFGICSFVQRGVKGWDWLAGFLKVPYRVDPRRILTPTHHDSIIFAYKIRVKKVWMSHKVTSLFKIFP